MTFIQDPYASAQPPPPPGPPPGKRGLGLKLVLVGAGVAAGAITATAVAANASTTSGPATTAAYSTTSDAGAAPATDHHGHHGDHGSKPVRADEKTISAATAAKLKAAALKAVPGSTVYRVESDSGDATYEAHMTKANGTEVTVKFDKNLAVTGVEAGMGR